MTLNITLLTERAIYQSADFRLTNTDTGATITDASTKRVTLQYFQGASSGMGSSCTRVLAAGVAGISPFGLWSG